MSLATRVLGKLRHLSGPPPVRERVVVRRVAAERRERLKPGFVIGVYRSGTTLLRYVLDSHPNIAVPPESNFLLGLAELWRSEWYRKGLAGVGVDAEGLAERLRELAWGVFDDYALAKGKRRWFDKTPAYVDALDVVDGLFGSECRYVMLYRHGLDVATSMAKMYGHDVNTGPGRKHAAKYPDSPRLTNALYWAEQCEKMLAFEAAHPGQCFRIHYEQYASEPARYLPPLFKFLGESWDPAVLRFAEMPHDFGLQDSKVLETRGFQPNTGVYRSWPEADIERARDAIGATLGRLGYGI